MNTDLIEAARLTLAETNLVGGLVTAGRWQYRAVWVRDACYSARGLVLAGRVDVVADVVRLYLSNLKPEGYGPKVFDSMSFEWRQVEACLRRICCCSRRTRPIYKDKLKANFTDTMSGREAFDSNALVLIAAHELPDPREILKEEDVTVMLSYYADHMEKGLFVQPAFTDWQDSLRREGKTCLMNMIIWRALHCCSVTFPDIVSEIFGSLTFVMRLKERILKTFYREGLFHSKPAPNSEVGLDVNLFALRWGFAGHELYSKLKSNHVWFATTFPADREYAWATWLAGMAEYHNSVRWSWLIAHQSSAAFAFDDPAEGTRLKNLLAAAVRRDGFIAECYSPRDLKPWTTFAYESDGPFTWGAAFVMELQGKGRDGGWGRFFTDL